MADSFGFETPKEALARINNRFAEANARITELGNRATTGAQAGQALANIFGRSVKKRIDTRRERVRFRDEVMAQQGLSKKEAMSQARREVSLQHAEVRQAQKMQSIEQSGRTMMDEMIEFGHPEARARAFGMFEVSRRLKDAGFPQEASRLKIEASELLQAQEERELDLLKLRTDISDTASTQRKRDIELGGDSDNFIRVSAGRIVDTANVLVTDVDQREELSEAGDWLNIGNSSVGLDFVAGDMGNAPKPIPAGTAEGIIAGLSMMNSINVMRGIKDQTGFIEGPLRNLAAGLGIGWLDNNDFIQVNAIRKKMRADIQSLVKGIPSNYDAGIFEAMIPDPGAFKDMKFYVAQLDVLERETKRFLQLTASFHMGSYQPVPVTIQAALANAGIDVGTIPAMSKADVERVKSDEGKKLEDQNNPFADMQVDQKARLRALDEQREASNNKAAPKKGDGAITDAEKEALRQAYGGT